MTLTIVAVTMPADLVFKANGHLDDVLVDIGPSGRLHHLAARAWVALQAAAVADRVPLTYSYGGTYRSYDAQMMAFRARYSTTPIAGRPTKQWAGQTWWQRPNTAIAAVPGTSNHGWGLAVDTALDSDWTDGLGPDDAGYIGPSIGWLEGNAPRFGWSWETLPSEPWHIRYVAGDRTPQAVLDFEAATHPDEEDDMPAGIVAIYRPTAQCTAQLAAIGHPDAGNPSWFALLPSGDVRKATGPDSALGAPFVDLNGQEHYLQCLALDARWRG